MKAYGGPIDGQEVDRTDHTLLVWFVPGPDVYNPTVSAGPNDIALYGGRAVTPDSGEAIYALDIDCYRFVSMRRLRGNYPPGHPFDIDWAPERRTA